MEGVPQIPSLPAVHWLGQPGKAELDGNIIRMTAGAKTDWFNDPAGGLPCTNAPCLVMPANHDLQLSARVRVEFRSSFDAGVLLLHQGEQDYAKLCFERAPTGEAMVVSVVTRGTSDDANGPAIDAELIHLRVSRAGAVFAFHYSLDGVRWALVRLFTLREPDRPTQLGFLAQSPIGDSCTVAFDQLSYAPTTLRDPRDGS